MKASEQITIAKDQLKAIKRSLDDLYKDLEKKDIVALRKKLEKLNKNLKGMPPFPSDDSDTDKQDEEDEEED